MLSLVSIIDDKRIEEMTDYAGAMDDVDDMQFRTLFLPVSLYPIETMRFILGSRDFFWDGPASILH